MHRQTVKIAIMSGHAQRGSLLIHVTTRKGYGWVISEDRCGLFLTVHATVLPRLDVIVLLQLIM